MRFAQPERGPEGEAKSKECGRDFNGLLGGQPPRALLKPSEEVLQQAAGIGSGRLRLGRNLGRALQGDEAPGGMASKFGNRIFDTPHHARGDIVLLEGVPSSPAVPPQQARRLIGLMQAGLFADHLEAVAKLAMRAAQGAADPLGRAGEALAAAKLNTESMALVGGDRFLIGGGLVRRRGETAALRCGPVVEIAGEHAGFVGVPAGPIPIHR